MITWVIKTDCKNQNLNLITYFFLGGENVLQFFGETKKREKFPRGISGNSLEVNYINTVHTEDIKQYTKT